jgi:hypothetical protein
MAEPQKYAWNCVLAFIQFTQEEIIKMKDYIDIVTLVRYQKSVTHQFLREHFSEDIDECLELDWNDIKIYVKE